MRGYKLNKIIFLIAFLFNIIHYSNHSLFADEKKISSGKIEDFRKRLNVLLEPKAQPYEPGGKNDPFEPFIRLQQASVVEPEEKGPGVCENPIECLDVSQLQVVAIVSFESGKNIAMVQDATSRGYVLIEGMKIGYREGRVKSIKKDGVVVTENFKDILGNQVKTEKILSMHSEVKNE